MVHNGIEYGLMQAYGEGFALMHDAAYDLDVAAIAELWRRGSVVGSWLLDLAAIALARDPSLAQFEGHVADSGEGRWTVMTAIEQATPVPVLTEALYARFRSRVDHTFAEKLLSALRAQFGGHVERPR
jgi:6-phosphogluconate dehydrogenase